MPHSLTPSVDSIIHFGEALSEKDLFNAEFESKVGDVALVLGTSLRVSPANTLPSLIYQRNLGKMIICNLQNTPCMITGSTSTYSLQLTDSPKSA